MTGEEERSQLIGQLGFLATAIKDKIALAKVAETTADRDQILDDIAEIATGLPDIVDGVSFIEAGS